jgi:hypothetical protein
MGAPKKLREKRQWITAKDPMGSDSPVLASPSIVDCRGTPVYLWVMDKSLGTRMIDADLHDDLAKGSKDHTLFEFEICCPRCSAWNRIPGTKKRIDVRYLEEPRVITHAQDGEPVRQVAVVTIDEPMTCSEPVGKTICGYRFFIKENRVYKA